MTAALRSNPVVYLVRHCQAGGPTGPKAPLTERGQVQALELKRQLVDRGITRIISSPYTRALQSVEPLAAVLGIAIEIDDRFRERGVPFDPELNWREHIRPTFADLDLVLPGGESSRAAITRAEAALRDTIVGATPVAVATHGQLLALLLMHLDGRSGFDTWASMTSPDVYRLTVGSVRMEIDHLWP